MNVKVNSLSLLCFGMSGRDGPNGSRQGPGSSDSHGSRAAPSPSGVGAAPAVTGMNEGQVYLYNFPSWAPDGYKPSQEPAKVKLSGRSIFGQRLTPKEASDHNLSSWRETERLLINQTDDHAIATICSGNILPISLQRTIFTVPLDLHRPDVGPMLTYQVS